jgi:stress response protein YsnF
LSFQKLDPIDKEFCIPVIQEVVNAEVQQHVTGIVRLEKRVRQHEQAINQELISETIAIEHISINRYINEPAVMRQEGDVTIFPVMEEIVITKKQLVLREEIRITRSRTSLQYHEVVPLRAEEVRVIRSSPDSAEDPAPSAQ